MEVTKLLGIIMKDYAQNIVTCDLEIFSIFYFPFYLLPFEIKNPFFLAHAGTFWLIK